MRVGILALQGNVREHATMLRQLKATPVEVKTEEDLDSIESLIIPGGESTTITKLLFEQNLDKKILALHHDGMPILGTCAGAIILAKSVQPNTLKTLNLMDIHITRNDYGRQIQSFEASIQAENTIGKKPLNAIFIRAPVIKKANCTILAQYNNNPVLVQEGNLLATTFHPELANDNRIHKYFLSLI
ncbi:MAG: pyridoxal 5'-phosphate synthase glutaminase subunit PdxT [Nanoarchaeota archaeon]|nr:pyridoxal 5'-phosphate synthase glutaminase subunit PdxT [Nanoarchaeota archaeon]